MKGCRPLADHEVEEILQSFGGRYAKRDRALFLLGVKTGFRISELLSLTIGDVLQHGRIVERVTVHRRHMKKKIEGRSVPLNPQAAEAVRVWIEIMRRQGPITPKAVLFRSRKGDNQPISRVSAYKVLRQVFADNELSGRLGTHSMRKTFANVVHQKLGRDISKTKKALGHKNINSTDSYLSFLQEEIDEAILAV
jgi:integrase